MKYLMMVLVLGGVMALSFGCHAQGSVSGNDHDSGASGSATVH